MITTADIKKGVVDKLSEAYPGIAIYGTDTTEGYKRPSVFLYIDMSIEETTRNCVHKNATVELYFIQKTPNEKEGLAFIEEISKIFSPKLELPDRSLSTMDFYGSLTGEFMNVPNVQFTVNFWDEWGEQEMVDIMKKVFIQQNFKEVE